MAWWRVRNARLMDGVRTGGELPPSVEDDAQNDLIYREYRDTPAADIQVEARRSWDLLAEAVQACSEDDLMKPHPYADGQVLWQTVSSNGPGHLGQHLMFWYLEAGDEASAEKAQLWASEVESAAATNEKQRAFATYNLACFYGRVGRAAAAVPLLRESFGAAPELVEWARKDPDLDRIRGDREIASLLAG